MTDGNDMTRRLYLAGVAAGAGALAGCGTDSDGADGTSESGGGSTDATETETGESDDGESATSDSGSDSLPAPVKGDPDASVTLVVYEDFACPACAQYNAQVLPQIESEYLADGTIRYEHRDFPFVAEPESFQAASAARAVHNAAGDGAFWSYAAGLFGQQERLRGDAPALFADLATEQGLDGDAIRTAGVEREFEAAVLADKERGEELGVPGTPAFALDGELVDLGQSGTLDELADALTAAVDDALAESDDGGAS